MRRVIIELPYAGNVDANVEYLRRALHDSLKRGEAPFASHAIYTQPGVLDDANPDERKLRIEAGFAYWPTASLIAFYVDHGCSPGMQAAMDRAKELDFPIDVRSIGP